MPLYCGLYTLIYSAMEEVNSSLINKLNPNNNTKDKIKIARFLYSIKTHTKKTPTSKEYVNPNKQRIC